MRAGLLRYMITIQRPVSTKTESGATSVTWTDVLTTRARVEHTSGSFITQNDELFHSYSKTFTIRVYHDIQDTDRISFDGKLYRILSIDKDIFEQQTIINTELINE